MRAQVAHSLVPSRLCFQNKPAKGPHPPRRTLCRTLAKWLVPRLPQQSQFNVSHEKLTMPGVAWNEVIAALDGLARSQGPPSEMLADLDPTVSDVRKLPKGKGRGKGKKDDDA